MMTTEKSVKMKTSDQLVKMNPVKMNIVVPDWLHMSQYPMGKKNKDHAGKDGLHNEPIGIQILMWINCVWCWPGVRQSVRFAVASLDKGW